MTVLPLGSYSPLEGPQLARLQQPGAPAGSRPGQLLFVMLLDSKPSDHGGGGRGDHATRLPVRQASPEKGSSSTVRGRHPGRKLPGPVHAARRAFRACVSETFAGVGIGRAVPASRPRSW